jgi:hypothetical protein
MIYVQWRVSFEGKHCTINDFSLASINTFTIGVRKGILYELLVDIVTLVHSNERLDEPYHLRRLKSM